MQEMDTQEKILLAAAEEFSEKGFAATSIRDISARAGMNHAGIYYHFKSKEELYKKVYEYLSEKLAPYRLPRKENISNGEEWMNAIYDYVLDLLSRILSSNNFMRLKNSIIYKEIIQPTEHLRFFYEEYISPYLDDIRYYVSLGLPDSCKDQVDFYVLSLISQIVFFDQNRAFVEIATGSGFYDKKNLERLGAHITQNLCGRLSFEHSRRKNGK
jgi:AcrR family transcriptional regulator